MSNRGNCDGECVDSQFGMCGACQDKLSDELVALRSRLAEVGRERDALDKALQVMSDARAAEVAAERAARERAEAALVRLQNLYECVYCTQTGRNEERAERAEAALGRARELLASWLTYPSSKVDDPFCGSATFGLACVARARSSARGERGVPSSPTPPTPSRLLRRERPRA